MTSYWNRNNGTMIPRAKAKNCRVYPLFPVEQKAMDEFLVENLETG